MAAAIRLLPCKYIRCSKGGMHILTSVFNVYKHSDIVWKCSLVQNYFYGYLQCAVVVRVDSATPRRHFTSTRYRGNSPLLAVLCFCSALFHSAAGQPTLARGWAKTHAPDYVVDVDSVSNFKSRLDKFWLDQPVMFDWKADLTGTGSRSLKCDIR